MTIDVGLPLATGEATHRRFGALALSLALAAVFGGAIALRLLLPFNVDVSWWLIVSERLLDGQRLYADILETNSPMAGSVYLLGVALARAIGARPEAVTDGVIFALIAVSLATTWRILRGSAWYGPAAGGALAVWAAALLTILPMYDFGQREHLAVVTLLPALAVYMLRGSRIRVAPPAIVIAGVCAALTMNFKPYFVFAVGFSIIAAAVQARDWRVLFAPENWIAAALVVIYSVGIAVMYPEYFTVIYPLVRDVYLLLGASLIAIFLTSATTVWLCAVMVVLALQNGQRTRDTATFVLLAGSLGFAISFFAQHKGWGYHAYPMVALGLMAAGCAIAAVEPARTRALGLRIAGGLAVAALLAKACVWFDASIDVRRIEARVAQIAPPHPKLLMLSAAATLGHPMVRSLDGVWVSRQEALWVREIVRRSVNDETIDAAMAARLQAYVARERAGLIADFRKQPPDIVLIDNRDSDWGAWAKADPELSVLLAPYSTVETVDGVDILSR